MTTPALAPTTPSSASTASQSPAAELFALTDEQILDIQPDVPESPPDRSSLSADEHNVAGNSSAPTEHGPRNTEYAPPVTSHDSPVTRHAAEPPPWLAAQMNDPQAGNEARDLWDGVQQARNEAAAYREVFSKPEEARAAADRAHALEEIDAAFFGGAGKSAEEISSGRAALAQRMLREDPAAFREMVFAGLRALESSANDVAAPASNHALNVVQGFSPASSSVPHAGLKPGTTQPAPAMTEAQHAQLAAYRTFEKSANEDLERNVGAAIQHSLQQALPVAQTPLHPPANSAGGILSARPGVNSAAQARLPALHQRLAAAVRDDVESALKSDTQLGEQLAHILSARRFDETARSQVVRLINDRAQQLVPVATRRIIQDWTQTTFAAHVGPGGPAPSAGAAAQPQRSPASGASTQSRAAHSHASPPAISTKAAAADRAEQSVALTHRTTTRPHGRPVDYARLSDEQILDL